jgi:RNA polymerase sigma factor (sigma-70 family)
VSTKTNTYVVLRSDRDKGLKLLFELYSKKLLSYATYQWKTEQDAAWDVIYKTMYKAADVIHEYEFESEEKFASFIFKIFMNYLRNNIRDTKTAKGDVKEIELNDKVINNYTEKKSLSSVNPALSVLQQELEKLEDWQRILLLMRSQDIPYSEISRYINKPEEQLKVYYGRLKKQIAERVNLQLINKEEKKQNVG